MNPWGARGKGTPYLFHDEGTPYLSWLFSMMLSSSQPFRVQWFPQCSPRVQKSQVLKLRWRIHNFSNSDCSTEAKQPQDEVLESKFDSKTEKRLPQTPRGFLEYVYSSYNGGPVCALIPVEESVCCSQIKRILVYKVVYELYPKLLGNAPPPVQIRCVHGNPPYNRDEPYFQTVTWWRQGLELRLFSCTFSFLWLVFFPVLEL